MSKKSRIITLSVLSILIVICIVLGVTYSFMKADIDSSSVTEVSLSSCANIMLNDTEVSIDLENSYPMSRNRALQTTPYTFTVSSSCPGSTGFYIYIATLTTNTLDASNIHYIITEHNSKDILNEGILSDATNGESDFLDYEKNELNNGINGIYKNIYRIYSNGLHDQDLTYDLYLFIDSKVTNNTMGQTFDAGVAVKTFDYNFATVNNIATSNITDNSITLTVTATQGANQITNYYFSDGENYIDNENNNAYTFNNLETGKEYNFSAYVVDSAGYNSNVYNLKETTLDIVYFANYIINNVYTGIDGENDLYYHDGMGTYTNANQEAGDNSYRYSGVNPNNYVCFGSNAATCPTDNLYRIIGVFDDRVKLIKSVSIGNLQWDSDVVSFENLSSLSTINNSGAILRLNDILAAGARCNGGNDWKTADLNYYLNNDYFFDNLDSFWKGLILKANWHVGGNTWDSIGTQIVKTAYTNEIENPIEKITYMDEIGLMYVSDYGYAAAPSNWTTELSNYESATSTNWMYSGYEEHTISPIFNSNPIKSFVINGNVSTRQVCNESHYPSVRPVFYLNSDVEYASGTGTINDPFRIN